jgi:hypothetical protein
MGHSSDVHKLILSDDGIVLVPMDADATARQSENEGWEKYYCEATVIKKSKSFSGKPAICHRYGKH